jgi:eukaryotic-like serine/threonine-protein kinase
VELVPGTVLLGKYRIDELIGSGGMGNVVRASHLYLHQPVAIKILLPEMAESESTKQRFLREAQATVKLRSEHSARVLDVGTTHDGAPFMVMEFLQGNDLNQILRHHGPQQPAIVVDLMLQACEGIAEAHALGIVHRDIKPSNFFITQRPDGSMLLKILDFGISKTPVGYGDLTGTQTVIGTPSYMAPEQMKSGRSADPRSDIWSMGVVMYQLIAGHPPFSGETYAELVLKVGLEPASPIQVPMPPGLGEVILRCLEKEPLARFQHVGELARVLAPYATDPATAAQSATRTMRTLQQRGAQSGGPMSPLGLGGGLATPIPISPAQLTPRSWPPSHNSSLSQGAGQVTVRTRSGRGLLIAGILGLCVVAGVGGYAVSQMSKSDATTGTTGTPAATGTTTTPAAAAATQPAAAKPDDSAAAAKPDDKPATAAKPDDKPSSAAKPDDKPATPAKLDNADPAVAKPADDKPAVDRPAVDKPAVDRPAVDKPAVDKPAVDKPADKRPARPASVKPTERKPPVAKPDDRRPSKPTKPKPDDDLFDSRR